MKWAGVAFGIWLGLAGGAVGQDTDAEKSSPPLPSVVQAKVREWVLAQKTLSAEAADWEEGKRTMADLNALRRREIELIDDVIAAAGKRLVDAEGKKGELEAEVAGLGRMREEMEGRIESIEEKVRARVGMFPAPLRAKISDELERLENRGEGAPLQSRFRDALVILGAAGQFQNSVTVESEVREFGRENVEVDVIYLGFAGAWYVDRTGKRAGWGKVGTDGWEWVDDAAIAEKVRRAIAMQRKEVAPGYVGLPFGQQTEGAE